MDLIKNIIKKWSVIGLLLPFALSAMEMTLRDQEIVTMYLHPKRTIDWSEKHPFLKLTGDIRAEWLDRHERQEDLFTGRMKKLRGLNVLDRRGIPIPVDTYSAQLNLRFDYRCGDSTWASGYLQFDNDMGIEDSGFTCAGNPQRCSGSGICDDMCVKRAFMGYRAWEGNNTTFDVEIGRRPMYTIFDSRIEFHSRFDGILLKLMKKVKNKGDFYINGGSFIIDYSVNRYGYVVETGVYDLYDTHFDIKYSYIDWDKLGINRCLIRHSAGLQFKNSQWSVAYNVSQKLISRKMRFYGAFLWNHAANKRLITHNNRKNLGWYAGFIIGEVKKKGDWSLDVNYQVVQAQAVSDCDMHGIGRGNVLKESFTDVGRGKGNYVGWHFETLYAITDKLSLDALYEFSKAEDPKIGGRHTFNKFELDFIHAF